MSRAAPQFIASLPHWARVAFAARCARNMLPLFDEFWPDSGGRRCDLKLAVNLAERSAESALAMEGLNDAAIGAVVVAGGALCRQGEAALASGSPPSTSDLVASLVAKTAEWAAKSAASDPSRSEDAALEAYSFARQAAEAAGVDPMLEQIHDELGGLLRAARKGRWTDRTPVPPRVFDLLTERPPSRRWWEYWR